MSDDEPSEDDDAIFWDCYICQGENGRERKCDNSPICKHNSCVNFGHLKAWDVAAAARLGIRSLLQCQLRHGRVLVNGVANRSDWEFEQESCVAGGASPTRRPSGTGCGYEPGRVRSNLLRWQTGHAYNLQAAVGNGRDAASCVYRSELPAHRARRVVYG
jgi:hypothetical protein